MRVIGMISGTSFDAIEAVAAELELDGQTLVADLRAHVSGRVPARASRGDRRVAAARGDDHRGGLPPRHGLGQRFTEVAAELRRPCSTARST